MCTIPIDTLTNSLRFYQFPRTNKRRLAKLVADPTCANLWCDGRHVAYAIFVDTPRHFERLTRSMIWLLIPRILPAVCDWKWR